MKIGIASDHRGYKLKEKIKKYLTKKGIEYTDYGTNSSESVDFPDFAEALCKGIIKKEVENGILICGTGIGMSIAANKIKGIMCAKVSNAKEARLAKEHNNANVISLSSDNFLFDVKDIIDAYLKAEKLTDEKYERRIQKIIKLEKQRKINKE